MGFFTVDTSSDVTFYEQQTQIEGLVYILQFYWSARESAWYLGIYDQGQNAIATGIRIVVDWPLLRRFTDPRLPPGRLIALDMSNQMQEIQTQSDLGSRVLLTYISSDDAAGLALVDAIAPPP
jgi:hypothetical protein